MDPTTTQSVSTQLLNMGLPGLIILVLAYVIVKLWNKIDDLQEKRLEEKLEIIKAMQDQTTALGSLTEVVKRIGPQ